MDPDDVNRLIASFVFCIIGTLAANGNMFWTIIMFAYMILMALWWASDKQEEIIASFGKKYWVGLILEKIVFRLLDCG